MQILEEFKKFFRPPLRFARNQIYRFQFDLKSSRILSQFGKRVEFSDGVWARAKQDIIWAELLRVLPKRAISTTIRLYEDLKVQDFWDQYEDLYRTIGNGREKAVEHAVTFSILDFSRIRRYCDVAASMSPIESVFKRDYSSTEYWKQDLIYSTDLKKRIVGGFAQQMKVIAPGFFDAMALHCSFEHFSGSSDREFISEVDRVLSPIGACLIVPLYLDLEHRIFLDPTVVRFEEVMKFDSEAKLCCARDYHQEHGRYYSPQTFCERLISSLPNSLEATIIRFVNSSAGQGVYLSFGLVLHRKNSVFRFADC